MSVVERKLAKNILPDATVRFIETLSRVEFAAAVGAPLLLVRIDGDETGELAHALLGSISSAKLPLAPKRAFHTVTNENARKALAAAGLAQCDPQGVRHKVRACLGEALCVVVPLRKRAGSGKSFTSRISVGRAMNNDVVLRHESISKFHAWLEADERARFFVYDASSRNGTWVGATRLTPKIRWPLPLGADLRFAAITTTMCRAETLWDALHTASDCA